MDIEQGLRGGSHPETEGTATRDVGISPFRAAVEAGDPNALAACLTSGVRFSSPAVYQPKEGRDQVMELLRAVMMALEDFRYISQVRDGHDEVLRFTARVGDRDIEGVDVLRTGADGLVEELTVMMRPLKGLMAAVEAISARLNATKG